jgi:hypothetical protein
MSRRTSLGLVGAMLAISLVTGCSSGDPQVGQLRSDPLVTHDIAGLAETQVFGQIGFTSLGTRQPATLTRLLKARAGRVTGRDLAAAAEQAGNDGWRVTEAANGTWTGTKRIDRRPVDLLIRRSRSSTYGVLVAVVLTERA